MTKSTPNIWLNLSVSLLIMVPETAVIAKVKEFTNGPEIEISNKLSYESTKMRIIFTRIRKRVKK